MSLWVEVNDEMHQILLLQPHLGVDRACIHVSGIDVSTIFGETNLVYQYFRSGRVLDITRRASVARLWSAVGFLGASRQRAPSAACVGLRCVTNSVLQAHPIVSGLAQFQGLSAILTIACICSVRFACVAMAGRCKTFCPSDFLSSFVLRPKHA